MIRMWNPLPGDLARAAALHSNISLKYKGKLSQNKDYEDIIIKTGADGSVIRLKDIARVEFGAFSYSSNGLVQGYPGTGIGIFQTAGSNANEILIAVDEVMKKAAAKFPKGIHQFTMFSAKDFLDASINQVKTTLLEAFILVFLVVFIFLQDFRSTLIPAIAVPVAIIGTFFFMQLFGFTINLLTLFALVLAIGIVVDDAIVVVEAVHSKMERTGLNAREATVQVMSEISGAIISITLVMAAVFVPVGFMQGTGRYILQAVCIYPCHRDFNFCTQCIDAEPRSLRFIFEKSPSGSGKGNKRKQDLRRRFGNAFNAGFKATTDRYVGCGTVSDPA